jgi:hypothetical protein
MSWDPTRWPLDPPSAEEVELMTEILNGPPPGRSFSAAANTATALAGEVWLARHSNLPWRQVSHVGDEFWGGHDLTSMPYAAYLQSQHWQDVRMRALQRAGGRCKHCDAADVPLDVHHLTYLRRGCEAEGDVTVLCRRCHATEHGKTP